MGFKNKKILLFLFIIIVGFLGFFLFRKFFSPTPQTTRDSSFFRQEVLSAEAINGLKVIQEVAKMKPIAVMIENHPDSRPQSGLPQADIVYETLAEGGITRFLAIYQTKDVETIGPVRSAREYFAQIADEWGALYAHVGGSNEVITQLKNQKYKNLADANEYYNFDFFPRRKEKTEPHHIFTSTQKLQELLKYHKFSNRANFQTWQFKDDALATTSIISKISIDFSRPGYEVDWEYNPPSNTYKRLQYFKPHLDENNGEQITARTIVIQIVNVTPVPNDPLLQVDIDLDAGGRAIIFQDGIAITGSWGKQANRTRFYDSLGQEIKFNRGTIWLELVPKDKEMNLLWQ